MKSLFILCGIFLAFVHHSSAQNPCQTPRRESGNCVLLEQCPALYSLLYQQVSQADKEYLRQSSCGYSGRKPKVCCASTGAAPSFTAADLPAPGACGTQLRDRIVGGEETSITDFPWMALLEYTRPGAKGGFFCGGVLINKHYVLTAAHCISGSNLVRNRYRLVSVRLGEHDLSSDRDCEEGECADPVVDVPVAETVVHENYASNSATQTDDIALIRLSQPVTFTDWIKPVCLPVAPQLRSKNFDNAPLIVAGFGKTENASKSDVKLQLELNGVNLNTCNNVYRSLRITLTPKQLCAGGIEGRDSCNGDSGGPIMGQDTSNRLRPYTYLAGLVSFGPRICGTPGWPGVYTKMTEYVDWTINHMRH